MKHLWILLLICSGLSVFAQNPTDLSWYKMLAGKIGQYPVTLHLHKAGHKYFGYYYYHSQELPIYITGEDTTLKGRIKLISFADPDENEEFSFLLSQNGASGEWKRTKSSTPLPFRAEETKAPLSFDFIYTTGSAKLRPQQKDSPEASYEAASVWPVGNSTTDNLLKELIRRSFVENYKGKEEIGALFLNEKKAYFTDYLKEYKNVKETELKELPQAYTMDETKQLFVAYQSPQLLTLAFSTYAYTGGAHGNYGTSYTSVDLVHGKKVTVVDVLNESGRKALPALLEKYFRESHNLKATDSLQEGGLFENRIQPNDNFYVTAAGIGFVYNPYEIGPYALGEITIFVPFKELLSFLQPSFRTLLQ